MRELWAATGKGREELARAEQAFLKAAAKKGAISPGRLVELVDGGHVSGAAVLSSPMSLKHKVAVMMAGHVSPEVLRQYLAFAPTEPMEQITLQSALLAGTLQVGDFLRNPRLGARLADDDTTLSHFSADVGRPSPVLFPTDAEFAQAVDAAGWGRLLFHASTPFRDEKTVILRYPYPQSGLPEPLRKRDKPTGEGQR